MANETATPLTYEAIQAWSGKEMREAMKDPTRRAEIDEVLRKKAEEVSAKLSSQTAELDAKEAARLQRQREIEAEREQAGKDREAETLRLSRLTPEERKAEYEKQQAELAEKERIAAAEKVAEEKEKARLSTMRPEERAAEAAAKEKAAAEAEKAEVDRIAAEEAAKAAAEKEVVDKAVAEKAAAEEAEKKALEEKTRIAAEEAAKPKTKIVREYQVVDPDTNEPLGRPTHLEADTWEEMSKKQQEAHEQAVRYAYRLKKRAEMKPTPAKAEEPIILLNDEQKAALKKELESKDEQKRTLAEVKLEQDELRKERIEARNRAAAAKGEAESYRFMQAHPEFFQCDANAKILGEYIAKNNLAWTAENLEIALADSESQLAQRPVEQSPEPEPKPVEAKTEIKQEPAAANPPAAPAPVAAVQPPAAPAAAAPTPAEKAPAAANPPATERKLPASGIEPGSLHGSSGRTGAPKPAGLTKQDIAKMPAAEFKKRLKDPNFKKQLNALGIRA